MMDSDVNNLSKVNYVTDMKSKLEIERHLFMNVGLKIGSFGEILAKLGFDTDKKLYLKRKNKLNGVGLEFYYSYDKDTFNDNNMIKIGCIFSRTIELICNGHDREYNICINYNGNNSNIYLENEYFEQKKIINGITYYYCVYNSELEIFINNDFGNRIEFHCDIINNENEMVFKLENNKELQEYILNIKFNDSIVDIFNNLCEYTNILNFEGNDAIIRNISINYLNNGDVISSYSIEKDYDNTNIKVCLKNQNVEEIVYKLNREKSHSSVKYLITLESEDSELKLELEIDDVNFEIKNELELRSYLLGLKYPLKIEEVFTKIKEISFSNVEKFEHLFFAFRCNSYQWTDMIDLRNGDLYSFKTTIDGKIFQFYDDSEFHYEVGDEISSYSIDMMGDIVTRCEQYCQNGIYNGDDANWAVYNVIRDAKEAKVRTRKIIDEMLKNERR